MAHAYSHLYGFPATGLRFFTVYGPWGRPDMAYFSFTQAILAGRAIDVFNHGQLRRDFTYIDDIVRVLDKPPAAVAAVPHAAHLAHRRHHSLRRLVPRMDRPGGRLNLAVTAA